MHRRLDGGYQWRLTLLLRFLLSASGKKGEGEHKRAPFQRKMPPGDNMMPA